MRPRFVAGALILAFLPAMASAAPPPPSGAEILQWIELLDSRRFVDRERATQALLDAGIHGIGPLTEALDGASLEVSTRGVFVLRELALSTDARIQVAAYDALTDLTETASSRSARQARQTLAALAAVRQDRAIRHLRKHGARVTDSHRQIGLQIVKVLAIEFDESWEGEIHDVQMLRWVVDAKLVSFTGKHIDDRWMENVARLENLTSLIIKRTSITERGVRHLSGLTRLQELDIKYSPVGDGAVDHLGQLSGARLMKLYGTKMTKTAALQLQEKLAQAEIDHRRGAFLGVGCDQPPSPCTVVLVQDDAAAARAEIKEGDVIVEYDGKPISDFDALKALIGLNKAGDSVSIKVLRGGKRFRRPVPSDDSKTFGLQGRPHFLGWEVTSVAEGSAAEQVGLKEGDIVTAMDDRPANPPPAEGLPGGDPVRDIDGWWTQPPRPQGKSIGFIRDARILTKRVEFGEWD